MKEKQVPKLFPKCFALVGPSGSGRTRLVDSLLTIFSDLKYEKRSNQIIICESSVVFTPELNEIQNLKSLFPDLITIFIKPPSIHALKKRYDNYVGIFDDARKELLDTYISDRKSMETCNYTVVNRDPYRALAEVAAILFQEMGGIIVAIDGPSACGKGAIAERTAQQYGGRHCDTGLIYRAVAKYMNDHGIATNSEQMPAFLKEFQEQFACDEVDEIELRTPAVDAIVPAWGKILAVRHVVFMLELKTLYGSGKSVIVSEGRSSTTHVFTRAELKYFVTCPIEIRGKRRGAQHHISVDQAIERLKARDKQDMEREIEPLRFARHQGVKRIDNSKELEKTMTKIYQDIDEVIALRLSSMRVTELV